jgi:hypothetical protein
MAARRAASCVLRFTSPVGLHRIFDKADNGSDNPKPDFVNQKVVDSV